MPLDLTSLIPTYQEAIDSIIDQMGKNVTLYFKSTVTNVNEGFFDPIRGDIRKPSYSETNSESAPIVTENTKTIKALIRNTPSDFERFGLKVNNPQGVVRLKTFLTDVPDLVRCEYMMPNSDSADYANSRYRLLRLALSMTGTLLASGRGSNAQIQT
jgi:hypothetical protein